MFADRKWLSQVPGSATPRGRRLEWIRVAPQSLMNLRFFFRKTKAALVCVQECGSGVWCQASGARLVRGEVQPEMRCSCGAIELVFFVGRHHDQPSRNGLFLDIALGWCLKWERDHPRECQGAQFSQEKKREMKQKLTQSLVMTINECKGCGLNSDEKQKEFGEGPVGTKDAIWVKIVGQKLMFFSSDFIWLHHKTVIQRGIHKMRWPGDTEKTSRSCHACCILHQAYPVNFAWAWSEALPWLFSHQKDGHPPPHT